MLILLQKDEPDQKSCIYKLTTKKLVDQGEGQRPYEEVVVKYFQIRVKSVEFMQKYGIAVYFYNFTP